jgi:hypothetical protein
MKTVLSTCVALLFLTTLTGAGMAQSVNTQITITPATAQTAINCAPNRFTGSARVQQLFDAKAPARSTGGVVVFQPGAAVRMAHSSPWPGTSS